MCKYMHIYIYTDSQLPSPFFSLSLVRFVRALSCSLAHTQRVCVYTHQLRPLCALSRAVSDALSLTCSLSSTHPLSRIRFILPYLYRTHTRMARRHWQWRWHTATKRQKFNYKKVCMNFNIHIERERVPRLLGSTSENWESHYLSFHLPS